MGAMCVNISRRASEGTPIPRDLLSEDANASERQLDSGGRRLGARPQTQYLKRSDFRGLRCQVGVPAQANRRAEAIAVFRKKPRDRVRPGVGPGVGRILGCAAAGALVLLLRPWAAVSFLSAPSRSGLLTRRQGNRLPLLRCATIAGDEARRGGAPA